MRVFHSSTLSWNSSHSTVNKIRLYKGLVFKLSSVILMTRPKCCNFSLIKALSILTLIFGIHKSHRFMVLRGGDAIGFGSLYHCQFFRLDCWTPSVEPCFFGGGVMLSQVYTSKRYFLVDRLLCSWHVCLAIYKEFCLAVLRQIRLCVCFYMCLVL